MLNVVWFKRDLRLNDHAPLYEAAICGPVLPVVIIEPAYWQLPDTSYRQWQFQRGCIADLSHQIRAQGGRIFIFTGNATDIFTGLLHRYGPFTLWSHEETGNYWTFQRDHAVQLWCHENGIDWQQRKQFGVQRGSQLDRNRWAADWEKLMLAEILPQPVVKWFVNPEVVSEPLPAADELGLADDGIQFMQIPGRAAAQTTLHEFLHDRGEFYTKGMSSPVTAETACSRLSPYLAYGCISLREALHVVLEQQTVLQNLPADMRGRWPSALRSLIGRLYWHCHFIQKLEAEPESEWQPYAGVYAGLRPQSGDAKYLQAWMDGRTGYPLIDACMRYLHAHGWINFRMRAMLMSFATYDLWLSWQEAGMFLARQFVDYEPGIHWPQCQMQSGETGINTMRVYSPIKQGYDQDPEGRFIHYWVPELRQLGANRIHEPWQLSESERRTICPDYPLPIVEHKTAVKAAKEKLYALRRTQAAKIEAKKVHQKHGSRKRGRSSGLRSKHKQATTSGIQTELDF